MQGKKIIGEKILSWYDTQNKELPWRGEKDPYRVWISEVVLQQTRVEQGRSYYERLIKAFPTVHALADAESDKVLLLWQGLGYYSRALNLHKTAKLVANSFGGEFPRTLKQLQELPGIGRYTSAAIASICFDEKIPAVDGNFYRVLSRLLLDDMDISNANAHSYFLSLAQEIMPDKRPGDFNQAMMDLGREVCKKSNPLCPECPVNANCFAYELGKQSEYPKKSKKTKVLKESLDYYFIFSEGYFLISQRDESGIWKKLYELPRAIEKELKKQVKNVELLEHSLSHRKLTLSINFIELPNREELEAYARKNQFNLLAIRESNSKSFPKPLERFLKKQMDSEALRGISENK